MEVFKISRNRENNKCIYCGKPLKRGKKYCSNKCKCEKEYEDWVSRWKNGEETGLKGEYGISSYLKRYLFEKYDSKCAICSWSERNPFTDTLPLEIEHIDGNYENNSEDNLILLCPNCHSLTATYKGANRGKGRKGRKGRKKYIIYKENADVAQ